MQMPMWPCLWLMSEFVLFLTEHNLISRYSPTNTPYDPIYTAAVQPNNVDLHTIYTSPNMRLTLISVTPFWAVSLKLVRYTKWDRVDVCLLLR